ncbi:mechanosensitive ion channel family protein [Anaerobranca gottschalkii]|uniref:Small conductance mechanosensitive channel n=1 Tax=Anaerobranca gottschalkii DSM 13577 TaxID=1120990 RepID=A0A1I0CHZ7_9FIRM|nr:mechanosensitive ion channel family protein [Anaerobranca gottschalkii]SET19030.1 small conductance mechanosensitive channel [Anaerobranca gottschalkii DSM 13577]
MEGLQNFLDGVISIDTLLSFIKNSFRIIVILILSMYVLKLGYKLLEKFFASQKYMNERKQKTLLTISKSFLKYGVYLFAALMILSELGFSTTSLLAGAGVVGLAIGFGAQGIVRDVITGFFILFEDQYSVGDYVKISGLSGVVTDIGIRVTKLRDFSGEVHIIPNGTVEKVTNLSLGKMRAMVDIPVAYEENLNKVFKVLEETMEKIKTEFQEVVEGPTILGVSNFGDSEVNIRIVAQTAPMEQWKIERIIRLYVKEAFEENGIEIPYPRRVLINKE